MTVVHYGKTLYSAANQTYRSQKFYRTNRTTVVRLFISNIGYHKKIFKVSVLHCRIVNVIVKMHE